jgi:hypothetical protein
MIFLAPEEIRKSPTKPARIQREYARMTTHKFELKAPMQCGAASAIRVAIVVVAMQRAFQVRVRA